MANSFKKVIFVVFAMIAMFNQASAQNNHNTMVVIGSSIADGSIDQYMVNLTDGAVFHNKGEEEAQFVGQFDTEELAAIINELEALKYKESTLTHKDGKPYQYIMIMGNGQEYSISWNDKAPDEVQLFYNHLHSRCGLLRSDYSISY